MTTTFALALAGGVEWMMGFVALCFVAIIATYGRSSRATGISRHPYGKQYSGAPGANESARRRDMPWLRS